MDEVLLWLSGLWTSSLPTFFLVWTKVGQYLTCSQSPLSMMMMITMMMNWGENHLNLGTIGKVQRPGNWNAASLEKEPYCQWCTIPKALMKYLGSIGIDNISWTMAMNHNARNIKHYTAVSHQFGHSWGEFELLSTQKTQSNMTALIIWWWFMIFKYSKHLELETLWIYHIFTM